MDSKKIIWFGLFFGSMIGGFIPKLWGAGVFSIWSMVLSAVGAIVGIYITFNMTR